MSDEYLRLRKKLRFNMIVASLFLFAAAMFAIMYGASYLSVYWVLGNYVVAFASFGGALAAAVLCLGLWLRIVLKMRNKLRDLDRDVPQAAVAV